MPTTLLYHHPPPPSSSAPPQDIEDEEDKEEKPQAMAASPPPPLDVVAVHPFLSVHPLEGDMATDGSNSVPLHDILKASILLGIARFDHAKLSGGIASLIIFDLVPMTPTDPAATLPRASAQVNHAALLPSRSTKPLSLPTMPSEPSVQPPSAVMPISDRCLHRIASPPPSTAAPSHASISPSVPAIISPFAITNAPPEPECTTSLAPPPSTHPDPYATVFLPSPLPVKACWISLPEDLPYSSL